MDFGDDEFMNHMGYRNMIIENKIKDCLVSAQQGETYINKFENDFTNDEIQHIQKEIQRRLKNR